MNEISFLDKNIHKQPQYETSKLINELWVTYDSKLDYLHSTPFLCINSGEKAVANQ